MTAVPNSFQTPNIYIDRAMPLLTNSELRCLLFATRHILGWTDKIDDRLNRIALSRFELAGISRGAASRALNSLVEYGFLERLGEKNHPDGQLWKLTSGQFIKWDDLELRDASKRAKSSYQTGKARSERTKNVAVKQIKLVQSNNTTSELVQSNIASNVEQTGTGAVQQTESNTLLNTKNKDSSTADAAELLDHDEPDGTSAYMIENQRKVKPGQDWLQPVLEKQRWDGLVLAFQESWPEFYGAPITDGLLKRIVNFCLGKLVKPTDPRWKEFQPTVNFITAREVRWLPIWYKQYYSDQKWLSQPDNLNKYFRLLRVSINNDWQPGQATATNGIANAEAYQPFVAPLATKPSEKVSDPNFEEQRRQFENYRREEQIGA